MFIQVMAKLILELGFQIVAHNTIKGPELGGGRERQRMKQENHHCGYHSIKNIEIMDHILKTQSTLSN